MDHDIYVIARYKDNRMKYHDLYLSKTLIRSSARSSDVTTVEREDGVDFIPSEVGHSIFSRIDRLTGCWATPQ